jgi:hypothetical protein
VWSSEEKAKGKSVRAGSNDSGSSSKLLTFDFCLLPFAFPLLAFLSLACLLITGCTLQGTQWELRDRPMTCDEANRVSYRTIEAMRFRVTAFAPAAAGQRGTIEATRPVTGSPGQTQDMTATIDCAPGGVSIDVHENGVLVQQLELKRAFYQAFVNVQAMRASEADMSAQVRAGTAPESQQRRDLQVLVQPLGGQKAKLDFPFDFAAAGVLPVRIDVTNLTQRTYHLDATQVRLMRPDRERVEALAPADAAARLAKQTAVGAGSIADALAARQLESSQLPPGAQRVGYLFFPLAQYTSGRVVLTDEETGEDDGVRVEF